MESSTTSTYKQVSLFIVSKREAAAAATECSINL